MSTSNLLSQNKENRPGLKNLFLPVSPVREQVKQYGTSKSSDSSKGRRFNEVERLMDQNKVSRNLSEYWFKNSNKPYNSYVKKVVKERLKYDEWQTPS